MNTAQAGHMLERARWAAAAYAGYDTATVSTIVNAVAEAGYREAERLAADAVQEKHERTRSLRRDRNRQPWIASAVQGEGCDLFWPCIDHPQGEPDRVDLHITVPSDLSAPANGRFLGKVDHGDGWTTWNWSAKSPGA